MHSPKVRDEAVALIAAGENDCEVGRRLEVPRSTIRDWRVHRYVRKRLTAVCPRCWRASTETGLGAADYSELLGLYLGDGHIVRTGRSDRLRLFLDTRYPGIIEDAQALIRRGFPAHRVGLSRTAKGTTTIVSVYSTHLVCLFPQHGPGRKHDRPIVLERWQREILERQPWPFLRGCIRSDGCLFVNRTGPYAYVSYDFSNRSADVLDLFTWACGLVGVECRRYAQHVRVYRRPSVALMEEHVGHKA